MRLFPLWGLGLLPFSSVIKLDLRPLKNGACLAIRFNSSESDVIIGIGPAEEKNEYMTFVWQKNSTYKKTRVYYRRNETIDEESNDCGHLTFDKNHTNVYIKHNANEGGWAMHNELNWTCPADGSTFAKEMKPSVGFRLTVHDGKKTNVTGREEGHGMVEMIAHCKADDEPTTTQKSDL